MISLKSTLKPLPTLLYLLLALLFTFPSMLNAASSQNPDKLLSLKKSIEKLNSEQTLAYKVYRTKLAARLAKASTIETARDFVSLDSTHQQFNEVYNRFKAEEFQANQDKQKLTKRCLEKYLSTLDKLRDRFKEALKKKNF